MEANNLPRRRLTWCLLFVGFCCGFGWLATNCILLVHFTNSRHFATLGATLLTVAGNLVFTSFYMVTGAAAMVWGFRRLKRTEPQKGLIKKSLIPAAILTPFLGVGGIAVILLTPFVFAHVRAFVAGPHIVQAADSPNGTYEAFVIDKPSLDGPNHHLYVREAIGGETFVASLPEDVDFNKEIIWSPNSDLVVFRTHFKMIAYSPATGEKQEVKLGGDYHWRQNGTFWVDYENVENPVDLQFPESGIVSYRLQGRDEIFTLTFGVL